jgi:hypothetical protein
MSDLEPGEIESNTPISSPVHTKPLDIKYVTPQRDFFCKLSTLYSDASRHKIIIRPRCKEYVKKQRAAGRSLACFTAMSLDEPSPDTPATAPSLPTATEKKDTPITSTERAEKLAKFFKLGSKPASTRVHSGRIEKSPTSFPVTKILAQAGINYPPAPVATDKMYSGSVKITATATPVKILTATGIQNQPYSRPSLPSLPSAQYPCTCRDPKSCPRCRLLALADRYVHRHRPDAPADDGFPAVFVPS